MYVSPLFFFYIFLGLGEIDQCFEWFEKAIEVRDGMTLFISLDPRMDLLRSDPRYAALLRKMNLRP
jgi:hypothetical protein